ncbi:MAG: biliverdin-producing heme oxygenase [Pseudomonadota bacterium]|nr:biliverdin-producing heme oxygenase [Pseudomonadota bacterium]
MSPPSIGARSGFDLPAAPKKNSNAENDVRSPRGREPSIKHDALGRVHRLLRAATRADHALLDRMMLRIDLATPQDYGIFLQLHQRVLQTLEAYWREEDREDFAGMQRAVAQDIQALGIATSPTTRAVGHTPLLLSHQWGLAYVVRGSRLGAKFLRRGVPSGLPTAYLDFTPALTWPRFLEQLELIPEDSSGATRDDSIRGARVAFEIFAGVFTQALAGKQ